MARAKGLKRIDHQLDVVTLIRKFFLLDVMKAHLIEPEKRAELRTKGRFIITPDYNEG